TREDQFLEDVATDEGETDFGELTVSDGVDPSETVEVNDDTVIRLDGKKVSLADLEEAFEDFQDEWGSDAKALVTVRHFDDDTGKPAIYVSVITNNIVEGTVDRLGSDTKGDYARIDGQKVYYDKAALGAGPDVDDEVVWLL